MVEWGVVVEVGHCEVVVTPFRWDGTLLLADSSLFLFLKNCGKNNLFFCHFFIASIHKKLLLVSNQQSTHISANVVWKDIVRHSTFFSCKSYIVWSLAKSTRASWERAMNFKPRLMLAIPNLLMYYHLLVASIISSQYTCTNNQNKAFFLFFSCRLPGRTARLCLLFWSWPETNEMRPISVGNHKIKNKR